MAGHSGEAVHLRGEAAIPGTHALACLARCANRPGSREIVPPVLDGGELDAADAPLVAIVGVDVAALRAIGLVARVIAQPGVGAGCRRVNAAACAVLTQSPGVGKQYCRRSIARNTPSPVDPPERPQHPDVPGSTIQLELGASEGFGGCRCFQSSVARTRRRGSRRQEWRR